jgi:hypothetical protein
MTDSWLNLRFVSKVEIVPASGKKGVIVHLEEDQEYIAWGSRGEIISRDRKLRLTDETVNFHYDYPDDFKKLVAACGGHFDQAYELYQALQKAVPSDWDAKPEEDWDDCECC